MFQVTHLSIKFAENTLLRPTHLTLQRGKVYTIYGPSGVGKSSLLNCLGLLAPLQGTTRYFFDGHEIDCHNAERVSQFIAEEVAFIFQQQNLLRNTTVFENLAIPLRLLRGDESEIHRKIATILTELGILSLKDRFPTELSGGEEQRVAIARALAADKTIILADEPTNSLDKENREKISALLVALAKKYHKIVVIVSHDEAIIEQGDVRLAFQNQQLHSTDEAVFHFAEEKDFPMWESRKKMAQRMVIKHQRKPALPKVLVLFVGLVVAMAVGSINLNRLFNTQYQQLIDQSLENGFLVINDSLSLQTSKVLDDLSHITPSVYDEITHSQRVVQATPYLEFVYHGLTESNAPHFLEEHRNQKMELTINTRTVPLTKPYSVQPLFGTHTEERYLDYFDRTTKAGVFVSELFIAQEKLSNIVPGSEITLTIYVPIALYTMDIEKDGTHLSGDGDLYVATTQTVKVLGILKKEYPFDYSSYGNTFFMDYTEMEKIQQSAIRNNGVMASQIGGLAITPWAPAAVHLKVAESILVPSEIERVRHLSESLTTVSSTENYQQFSEALNVIQQFLFGISGVLLVLVGCVLFFVFYLMNDRRKLEVGILKALGLRTKSVVFMYFKELLHYGRMIFVTATVTLFLFILLLIIVIQLAFVDAVSFWGASLLWLIILSFSIVIVSGLVPIYSACRQTVVDTIRLNR